MNSQLRKGVMELCVLAMIRKEDLYGYELIRSLSEKFPVKGETIYPVLKRLTNGGFLSTYIGESSQGPSRKYYKITPEGERQYQLLHAEWSEFSSVVNEIFEEEEH
ncbi:MULTISPECIES: PadR family transcriptional regulator [Bacillus amyloliquefaciens group]|uniref:PadR family transcriptional regulator n=1 Tax=Bacillus amyloliquefaciens group TaxID=1938374 RepID=UPI000EFAA236|nr:MULTISPECIES: PadR family transcriptional regulator [Bacillus amyloliquefaciens group]MCV4329404.1 PadR family transcriptional regulator [Bacillus velezensis]MDH3075865.1 PadR family transcriptional regulator [Bacillus velezensis]MDH3104049.1 PadR family transcriptional regulator [Bacillus velezensis]MDH3138964.1 PadR family transcriptional regulator [Bacillus velezensis]MDQ8094882.1 PadR family transcriptional regulator [Bacillus amyloliquefaciens]